MPSPHKPLLTASTRFVPPMLMADVGTRLLWAAVALLVLWVTVFWAQS